MLEPPAPEVPDELPLLPEPDGALGVAGEAGLGLEGVALRSAAVLPLPVVLGALPG